MIESLKPYSGYTNTHIPWIGNIPQHWKIERAKWHFDYRKEINSDEDEANILSLTLRGVVKNDQDNPEGLVPENYRTYQKFKRGDFVFKLIDLENFRTSRVGLVPEHGLMSPAYIRLVPKVSASSKFFLYQFLDLYQRGIFNQLGAGVRSTLGPKDLLDLPILKPDEGEQGTIVRFLEHLNFKIRQQIRLKQQLINLLEEQKQTSIHRTITQGLDPNVSRKPSGLKWLGAIPEHWETKPAKYFYREVNERSATGQEELLSVSHLTGVTSRSQKNITMFMASSYVGHKVCRPGDLVINTMWAWMAALGIAQQTGLVSPAYSVYRPLPNTQLLGEFADLLLRIGPYVSEYKCRSTGVRSSRLRLYPEHFLRIRIICPPINEQKMIVERIQNETAEVTKILINAQREINLLREYGTRLVADVITGKLDVRGASKELSDALLSDAETVDSASHLGYDDGTEEASEEAEEDTL